MDLTVIGTGSAGNMYLLNHEGQKLILDAGMPMKDLLMVSGGLKGIEGCLITHEHLDHSKALPDMLKYGIRSYATEGTIRTLESKGSFLNRATMGELVNLENYSFIPFPTQHDAEEPCGFLIKHRPTGTSIVYATDTYYLKNTFPMVHFWVVECNYCDNLLHEQEIEKATLNERQLLNRLRRSHMSLKRLKQTLGANDLTRTRKIILVHLSDERSDEEQMVREVQEQTGIETIAADRGLIIDMNLAPF